MQFQKNIEKILQKFQHDFYVVKKMNDIQCRCVDFTSKKADPSCKKCLGLGTNIKIVKTKGVTKDKKSNFSMGNSSSENNVSVYSAYYTKPDILHEDDIIVDDDEVSIVFRVIKLYEENGKRVYDKILAVDKKSDIAIFLKNFYPIVR